MDTIPLRAQHIFIGAIIVISLFFLVSVVSESIPLRTALRVEGDGIVIYTSRSFIDDVVAKSDAVETWRRHFVEGPVYGDAGAVFDFGGGEGGVGGCEEVEHAEFIGGAPEAPGVAVGA